MTRIVYTETIPDIKTNQKPRDSRTTLSKGGIKHTGKGKGKSNCKNNKRGAKNSGQHTVNLETKHSEYLEKIRNKYKPQIQKNKNSLDSALSKLDKLEDSMTDDATATSQSKLLDKITDTTYHVDELRKQLRELKKEYNTNLSKYYSRATSCLIDYYKPVSNWHSQSGTNSSEMENNKSYHDIESENMIKPGSQKSFIDIAIIKNSENRTVNSKARILEKYLLKFDPNYVPESYNNAISNCKLCNSNLDRASSEGEEICMMCGYTRDAPLEGVQLSYKDLTSRQANENYSYSKCSHLKFHLEHFQGKAVPLPDHLLDALRRSIKTDGINCKKLTISRIRKYLFQINSSKYYENANYIIEQLGGPKAPKLDKDFEDLVISMFTRILVPFTQKRDELFVNKSNKDRRNLVIYNYILYKIFEILGRKDLLKHLYLLKTQSIIVSLDHYWHKTKQECGFQELITQSTESLEAAKMSS